MPAAKRRTKVEEDSGHLKGWDQIAGFLGQPRALAQRWAKDGMPVVKKGRYVTASVRELTRWLGRESGLPAPVHIAADDQDLSQYLRAGLKEVQRAAGSKSKKAT